MRATRRRTRKPDPLASPEAIHAICKQLRDRLPDIIPASDKQLLRLLYAVRHVERRPATDTLRGGPVAGRAKSSWKRPAFCGALYSVKRRAESP